MAIILCIGLFVGVDIHQKLDKLGNIERLLASGWKITGTLGGSIGVNFTANSIHTRILIMKADKTILDEYHAGATTKLGQNLTLCKLTGNGTAAYNLTTYTLNLTYVSIGNQGALDSDSIVLPSEWNRTTAIQHDPTYHTFNLTAVFHPGTGPYTADCLGVNYEDGIGNNALWGYDTFNEVTGIDDTFTITLEIIITVA